MLDQKAKNSAKSEHCKCIHQMSALVHAVMKCLVYMHSLEGQLQQTAISAQSSPIHGDFWPCSWEFPTSGLTHCVVGIMSLTDANSCTGRQLKTHPTWPTNQCDQPTNDINYYNASQYLYACMARWRCRAVGAVVQLVEYRTRNQEVASSTHTRPTASNLEQVANLLCAHANSPSYHQLDGKWVVATATGWRPSVTDWGDGVSASCTIGPIVR